MEGYLLYFIVFCCGIITNIFWNHLLGLGTGIMMVRTVISDCLMVVAKNVQSVYEINELKYMSLEMSGKDERFIEFQKTQDKMELSSLRNTVIRNFVNAIPSRYDKYVPFNDWGSAMDYLDKEIKKRRSDDTNK